MNFDLDGVTLDFWRHPVFFRKTANEQPCGDEERALMTQLLRDIRTDLDAAMRRHGRAIALSIKVPDSASYCRDIGLDVERWLAEGLADFLVPGGYFQLNHWPESVALARKHGVKIHASLPESRVRDEAGAKARSSIEALRARALAAWAAGVDGIEMFNHFDVTSSLWRELGDPALLRTLPKTYFASVQGASNSRGYYPAGAHFKLPKLTPDAAETFAAGGTRTYELHVGDDLRNQPQLGARLVLRAAGTAGQAPQVRWGDTPLMVSAQGNALWAAPLASALVVPGVHRVTITAAELLKLDDLTLRIEAP